MILHHLGIACSDIRETLEQLQAMFPVTGCSEIVHDPEQDAELCLVSIRDSLPLELIAGPVVSNLVRKGIMLYHACWEAEQIEEVIDRMRRVNGCMVVSEPKPAVLFGRRRVAFLNTPVGLVEILVTKSPNL